MKPPAAPAWTPYSPFHDTYVVSFVVRRDVPLGYARRRTLSTLHLHDTCIMWVTCDGRWCGAWLTPDGDAHNCDADAPPRPAVSRPSTVDVSSRRWALGYARFVRCSLLLPSSVTVVMPHPISLSSWLYPR